MKNRSEIIETIKEIKTHCESTSRGVCSAGGCIFSEEKYGCIFEALGLNQPEDWDLEAGEEKEGKE